MPYAVLMPIVASDVLHGGPNTLGFSMTASGLGALAGAVTLAIRRTVVGLGMRIVVCSGLFGVSLIGFGLSRHLWLSLLILPVIGFAMMQHMASSNTILQTIVDDEKRGRVMAFYSMAFQGIGDFRQPDSRGAGCARRRPENARSSAACSASRVLYGSLENYPNPALVRPIYVRLDSTGGCAWRSTSISLTGSGDVVTQNVKA